MKILLICTFAMTLSFAHNHDEDGMKGEKFEQRKERALKNINMRISQMEKAKSCISSASKMEDLKACRKQSRETMKEMKQNRKERRKERQNSN